MNKIYFGWMAIYKEKYKYQNSGFDKEKNPFSKASTTKY